MRSSRHWLFLCLGLELRMIFDHRAQLAFQRSDFITTHQQSVSEIVQRGVVCLMRNVVCLLFVWSLRAASMRFSIFEVEAGATPQNCLASTGQCPRANSFGKWRGSVLVLKNDSRVRNCRDQRRGANHWRKLSSGNRITPVPTSGALVATWCEYVLAYLGVMFAASPIVAACLYGMRWLCLKDQPVFWDWSVFFLGGTERGVALTLVLLAPSYLAAFIGGWVVCCALWLRLATWGRGGLCSTKPCPKSSKRLGKEERLQQSRLQTR
jgi:hypothetical protein